MFVKENPDRKKQTKKKSYCPLIWIICNRKSMKKVNRIQEHYLRLVTNNYELSYEELLDLTDEIKFS